MRQVVTIALGTFREAVRDRVLYNLVVFALLIVASALLFGQISVDIERIVLINMGLSAISIFGIFISILVGIGLVWKEIERRTLYTVLAHPVSRWQFLLGKFTGLLGTLTFNSILMAVGFFAALLYLSRGLHRADLGLLAAIYLILLQFVLMTSISLLFSTFSTPLLSSIMAFSVFVIGSLGSDLHEFAASSQGLVKVLLKVAAVLVPDLSSLNVISSVAHDQAVSGAVLLHGTLYTVAYSAAVLFGAVAIFENRNLK
jgi:ABC-type transport system involved in multi-copper enzyme maturation permease subunit